MTPPVPGAAGPILPIEHASEPSRRSDRLLLYATALARSTTTGLVGVLIGTFLARRGVEPTAIGIIVAAGLAGAAVEAAIATFFGDRIGRRVLLVALATATALGALAFAFLDHPLALGLAAFVGALNGMGKDRGASPAIEQAALPSTVPASERTNAIAWHTMLQDVGHASGALLAGAPALFHRTLALAEVDSDRLLFVGVALIAAITVALYTRVSAAIEVPDARPSPVTPATRRILLRVWALFALDSVGGGFLTTALLSFFFFVRFGVGEETIAVLFFVARLLNALSHLGAAWLARRIGLVRTMVWTHLPSSLLLVTVAFAPSFPVAAVLFLIREGVAEMDVPTRQSYLLAVVEPSARTLAASSTSLVRMGAWVVGPALTGWAFGAGTPYVPLVVGAALKIAYDLLLWRAFSMVRPPEER